MSNRFYPGQKDYIEQLNLLDDQVQAGAAGSVTAGVTSFNTRSGPITLNSSDVIAALAFTPYNAANPDGYITAAALTSYAPKNNPTFTGTITIVTPNAGDNSTLAASTAFVRRNVVRGAGAVATTFSATPNFDCGTDSVFDITLTGNVTGATLGSPTDGQKVLLRVKQDSVGNRTFSFAENTIRFSEDLGSLLISPTANKTTYIGLVYNASASRFDLVSVNKGF